MADYKEETRKTYDKIAEHYSKANSYQFWVGELERFRELLSGKKIIDIGCGAGRDAAIFTREGFDYTGIDASEAMLKIAKEVAPEGVYKQMDFFHLDFQDNSFDGFWAAASYLHIPKAEVGKALAEAERILKPGGVGFISLKERNGMEEGMIEQTYSSDKVSRFFAFYEKGEFERYLTSAGFELVGEATHFEQDERNTTWLGYFVRKP